MYNIDAPAGAKQQLRLLFKEVCKINGQFCFESLLCTSVVGSDTLFS